MYFKKIVDTKVKDHIPDIEIISINHDKDHVYIQISIPLKVKISDFIRILKSITGRLSKQRFEYLKKAYCGIYGIWSDVYFVSTICFNENIIKKYIENQYKEDIGEAEHSLIE